MKKMGLNKLQTIVINENILGNVIVELSDLCSHLSPIFC